MKNIFFQRTLVVSTLLVSTLLASCGITPTKATSNKSPDYTAQPKKVYALIAIDAMIQAPAFPDLGKRYTDAFTQRMTEILHDCSVEFAASTVTGGLDSAEAKTAIQEFNPDSLLLVKLASYKKVGFELTGATYDASILDSASRKMVWRANLEFSLSMVQYNAGLTTPHNFLTIRGGDLAVDLTNQMKKDGILTTCPLITPRK